MGDLRVRNRMLLLSPTRGLTKTLGLESGVGKYCECDTGPALAATAESAAARSASSIELR